MFQKLIQTGSVLMTIVLMLATCEMATRLFAPVASNLSHRDVVVGRRYFANLNQHVYSGESKSPVLFRTNQYGFRGQQVEDKPQGVSRVAVVGDSFTASEALPEEETFCHELQSVLSDTTGRPWEVLNFGISGSGTGQELALYRNVIRHLDVDVVLVAFGNATDVRDNSMELGGNPIIHFDFDEEGNLYQVPQSDQRVNTSNFLNHYSRFYKWQKSKTTRLVHHVRKQTKQPRGQHMVFASNETPEYTRAWELTSEILKTFRDECASNGTELMVTGIPSAFQVYPDLFEEIVPLCDQAAEMSPSHPDERLHQICERQGIPFFELTERFRANAPSGSYQQESEQLFIKGRGHLNRAGSQVVASELSEWISSHSEQIASGRRDALVR